MTRLAHPCTPLASLAVRGMYLRLLDEDGWRVEAIYARMETRYVAARSRDHMRQRSASDI